MADIVAIGLTELATRLALLGHNVGAEATGAPPNLVVARDLESVPESLRDRPLVVGDLDSEALREALQSVLEAVGQASQTLHLADGILDLQRGVVARKGVSTRLSPIELRLIQLLVDRQGQPVSKAELLQHVWGVEPTAQTRTLSMAVRRLRKKIEADPRKPVHLRNRFGAGYFLAGLSEGSGPAPARGAAWQLLGRSSDLQAVQGLLAKGATTVVGAGGVGKTTLARAIWEQHPADSRMWCSLADAANPEEVLRLLLGAAGIQVDSARSEQALGRLRDAFAAREELWVLDNAEHVAGALAEVLSEVLPERAAFQLLVTSRRPLGLAREQVYALPGLDPEAGAALLQDRHARHPGRRPLDVAVGRALSARLEGIPLALELAASRFDVLSPEAVLDRLHDSLEFLGRSGRDTLWGCVDWSWKLLTPPQRQALAQCTVFVGSFDLSLAERVLRIDEGTVPDALTALVEQSLLQSTPDQRQVRLRLPDTVSDYAAAHLPADHTVHQRFLEACVARAEAAFSLQGAGQPHGHDADNAHLRKAVRMLASARDRRGALVSAVLAESLSRAGQYTQASVTAERGLALASPKDAGVRAELLALAAHSCHGGGRRDEAARLIRRAIHEARRADDPAMLARILASAAGATGDREQALERIDEAEAIAVRLRDELTRGLALSVRAAWLTRDGKAKDALAAHRAAVRALEQAGSTRLAANARMQMAFALANAGHDEEALRHLDELLLPDVPIDVSPRGRARALRSTVLHALGRLDESEQAYAEVAQELRARGDRLFLAASRLGWASLRLERGDAAQAVEWLNEVLEEVRGFAGLAALARAYLVLGLRLLGREGEAEAEAQRLEDSLPEADGARRGAVAATLHGEPFESLAGRVGLRLHAAWSETL
jgi:predicted ATPase/DNA-binding winged helix-turn-helix (wHTH) protein